MQKETPSIGLALFVGMFTGGVVAFESLRRFGFHWAPSWFGGLVAGGGLAYIAQDLRGFIRGLGRAWHIAGGWRSQAQWWWVRLQFSLAVLCAGGFMGFYVSLLGLPIQEMEQLSWMTPAQFLAIVTVYCAFAFWVVISISFFCCEDSCCEIDNEEISRIWKSAKNLSPPFAVFWIAYGIFHLLRWAISQALAFARFASRFLRAAARYIHSSKRVLCLVYSSAGVTITFFTDGSPFAYALVGAMCGMVQWEVSARWRHAPQKRNA